MCEISGSHGGEYEVQSLLRCTTAYSNWCRPTFQRCVVPPSSGRWVSLARKDSRLYPIGVQWTGLTNLLMLEAVRTSETSVDICLNTRQYIPENCELHKVSCDSFTATNKNKVAYSKETVKCRHLIFWLESQWGVYCHIAKLEPNRRVTIDRVPL
jgi:hypothetical protein